MNVNDYTYINSGVLKFVGLYPINIVKYLICIICMLTIIFPQIVQLWKHWNDLDIFLETCSVLLTIVLAVLKSVVWILKRERVESFIKYMLNDFWENYKKHFSTHLHKYATFGKNVTRGYLFLICNALLFFFSLPLIEIFINVIKENRNYTKHFPFVATYPESYYDSPIYEVVYISQIVATSVCGMIILATDTLIATALFHTCAHFKIIQEDLQKFDKDLSHIRYLNDTSEKYEQMIHKLKVQVKRIIKHHQSVIWFCDNTEDNFNPILLLQTLASSLIICLVGLQVSTTLTDRYKLIKYSSYLMMAMFQLLLFSFPGDELITQSFMVNQAVYFIKWFELPKIFSGEINLIMLRAQKPNHVTAGKFYTMHLANFSSVLSTAASYFMVLRSFNAEE